MAYDFQSGDNHVQLDEAELVRAEATLIRRVTGLDIEGREHDEVLIRRVTRQDPEESFKVE